MKADALHLEMHCPLAFSDYPLCNSTLLTSPRWYDRIFVHITNSLPQILRCSCGPQQGLAGRTVYLFLCDGSPSVWVGRFTLQDPW